MRPAFFLFLAALMLPAAALSPAWAPAAWAQARGDNGVQPLDRLLPEIRRTHPGKFYDADGPTPDAHYHLKWLTPEGRVEWLDTDARTGRVMNTSPGRDNFDAPRDTFEAPRENRGGDEGGFRGRFGQGPSGNGGGAARRGWNR